MYFNTEIFLLLFSEMYADHARAQGLYELEKQEHSKTRKG